MSVCEFASVCWFGRGFRGLSYFPFFFLLLSITFFLSPPSFSPLQQLRHAYKANYGSELLDDIKSETSGDFRKALVALIESRVELRARLLHESLAGAGTDIQKLIDVLVPMHADEIVEVKDVYKKKYDNELEDDVKSDTSGEWGR